MALMIRSWPTLLVDALIMAALASLLPPCEACFQQVEPLTASEVWLQPTGVYSHLRYQAEMGEDGGVWNLIRIQSSDHRVDQQAATMYNTPKSRPSEETMTCLKVYPSHRTKVRVDRYNATGAVTSREFQCLGFKPVTDNVIQLLRSSSAGATEEEVDCEVDRYKPDDAVLIQANEQVVSSCSSEKSYQAMLKSSSSSDKKITCRATIQHVCQQNRVVVSFDARCKIPVFKYLSNKRRQRLHFNLRCVGSWTTQENTMVEVLRDEEDRVNFWCIRYTRKDSTDELVDAYINFDGSCSFLVNNKKTATIGNAMSGHLVSFVSSRDKSRCGRDIDYSQCQGENLICSESNACPGECQRCYQVPKFKECEFKESQLGHWETVTSQKKLSVHVGINGVSTSSHGSFACVHGDKPSPYVANVVQFNESKDHCLPFQACVSIFTPAPGVLTFYFRPTALTPWTLTPTTCTETNDIFRKYPTNDGKMVTLLNEHKLKKTFCDFGEAQQFVTGTGLCLLDVAGCSGQCDTMNVSLNNETCHNEPIVLPIAAGHRCHASLKFSDGVRGLLTYSEELEKYSCWIFTSSRLFVTESSMCNYEMVFEVFRDKKAVEKYDPIKAFTIVPRDSPSRGTSLQLPILNPIWIILCSLTVVKLMQ